MTDTAIEFRPIDRSQHELLVVDDDPASRYTTARLLRSAGFRTREAATGEAGLQSADDSISAMVLDVHLPDIDGFELCRRLRLQPATRRLPVLHLTAAYVTDEDKVRGLDAGADAYLTHPVEPAVLVATVQALVRARVAEDAMRHSEAKFRAIYSQAPGGICLLDAQGRFVDVNPAMLHMLKRGIDEVLGHPVCEFVPPDWVERVRAGTGVEDAPAREFPLLSATGQHVHVEWKVSPHLEPGIRMALVTDVSERVALEQQRQQLLEGERIARGEAERTNRMKDDLIAVLSHELRTPLNAIMGWTHVLQRRGVGTEVLARGLEAIERNGQMQARMISDILDMSRLNLGKLQLKVETVDPTEAVTSAINAMRPSIEENDNRLVVEMASSCRPIQADAARLQQVVWNLLSNAVKFSPPGGEIRVALHEEPDGLRLTVADQGQGIEPEALSLIFDRFVQSPGDGNRYRGGLGLGLSIVKHLVEAHGGRVQARSQGLGQGAEFEVRLPFETLAATTDERGTSLFGDLDELPEASLHGLRLLLVEDDVEAAQMLRIILGDHGASLDVAHDVDAALASLTRSPPDVVISDIGMPGRTGYDLLREIRRREAEGHGRVPAIALTSFAREQDRAQALAAGFDEHLAKPLRALQLVQAVMRLVGRPGLSG